MLLPSMNNAATAAGTMTNGTRSNGTRITVQARALQRASEAIGGVQALARYLDVPSAEVRQWMFNVGTPPSRVFLRVVDLLLDEGQALSVQNDIGPI
jgi:hypothetical protein